MAGNKMKTLKILCGNLGAGKSTYANNNSDVNNVVISRDAIRYMLGGGKYLFDKKLESLVYKIEFITIIEIMKKRKNIIIDTAGLNKDYRQRYIKLAKRFNYNIEAIIFPSNIRLSVIRKMRKPHNLTNKKDLKKLYLKFESLFEMPTKKEGFKKITMIKKNVHIIKTQE